MLIKCPNCKTTYKVSDEVLKGTTPVFRCSRCKHTFELQGQASEVRKPLQDLTAPAPPNPEHHPEGEFNFRFPGRDERTKTRPQKLSVKGDTRSRQTAAGTQDEEWALMEDEASEEKPFTISDPPQWDKDDDFDDARSDEAAKNRAFEPLAPAESDDNVLALEPYRDQQASTLPYMTLFALLIICFSLLTALHITYPAASEAFVRDIPLIGNAVTRNGHLKNGLALKSIQGSYQTIQGDRNVFVVTGIATNENPVIVREVQLGGQTYNQDGKTVEKQSMWVRNALSANIIRGMTLQDISDLQRLKPLKSFEIPPGDSIPFTIVFLKSGKGVKEFSCKVLAAEGNV